MGFVENVKNYLKQRPIIKKVVGVILILLGITALITPFTPGSWLIFVGLELLGFRLFFYDYLKKLWSGK